MCVGSTSRFLIQVWFQDEIQLSSLVFLLQFETALNNLSLLSEVNQLDSPDVILLVLGGGGERYLATCL